jgi:hypothetical protein
MFIVVGLNKMDNCYISELCSMLCRYSPIKTPDVDTSGC